MNEIYYTLKEISFKLKTPIPYLRKLIKNHQLKAHFIGRKYLVNEIDLITFINSRGVKNER